MAVKNSEKQRGSGRPFKAGQSGNLKGRPRGTRNVAWAALDAIGEKNAVDILKAAIEAAKKGDMRAADTILRRVWPERKGRPVSLDLPEIVDSAGVVKALSAIVRAVCAGRVTTDEAQALAGLIESQRRAIETGELEARIAALEGK